MKSLNNFSVDAGEAGAGEVSEPGVGSRPSVGAEDPRVNELDELATHKIPSFAGVGDSVRH